MKRYVVGVSIRVPEVDKLLIAQYVQEALGYYSRQLGISDPLCGLTKANVLAVTVQEAGGSN